jgi:hypothetical protein
MATNFLELQFVLLGGPIAEQHIEGNLSSYHKTAHEKGTPHLKSLFIGLQQHPHVSTISNSNCPARIRDDLQALANINEGIKTENITHEVDLELGFIQYDRFCGI